MPDAVDDFRTDVRTAAAVCAQTPLLVLITAGIAIGGALPGVLEPKVRTLRADLASLVLLGDFVLLVGWLGTQQMWFLRRQRGLPMLPSEVWRFTWRSLGRFFGMNFCLGLLLVPALVLRFVAPAAGLLLLVAGVLLIDATTTFVVPELAYTTGEFAQALKPGWAMCKAEWPACRWYVIAPPLALQTMSVAAYAVHSFDGWLRVGLSVVAALLALVFRLAIDAYYLRHRPVGPDGAMYVVTGTADSGADS